jgi:uncharacterized protein YbgA (DUF1722 family)
MRLTGDPADPRLVTIHTGIDHTARMQSWAARRLDALEKEDLCGFVFKAKSPSSGMISVKVYTAAGMSSRSGAGIFARMFMERFPQTPVEEEGRLSDAGLRENFLVRVFAFARWKSYVQSDGSRGGLVAFHARHKYLLMAHSPTELRKLGALVAGAKSMGRAVQKAYQDGFMEALKKMATVRKNTNVLQHMAGYFRNELSSDEKLELQEAIEGYRRELYPMLVPATLLRHFVCKYQQPYLSDQCYLEPHPAELMLRYHA